MTGETGSPSRWTPVLRGAFTGAVWGLAAAWAYALAISMILAVALKGGPRGFLMVLIYAVVIGSVVGLVLGAVGGAVNGLLAVRRMLSPVTAALVVLVPGAVVAVVFLLQGVFGAFLVPIGGPAAVGAIFSVLQAKALLRWAADRDYSDVSTTPSSTATVRSPRADGSAPPGTTG